MLSQRKRDDDVPELCAIVDERNRVVDFVDRERTTRERLRGRGSYVLVTTRTPRPPRGQSAVTNNNTEDQGQDQDEEEEEEEEGGLDDGRERCRRVPRVRTEAFVPRRAFGRRGADAAKKGRRRTRSENDDDEVDA